jgi:hypothetical protein
MGRLGRQLAGWATALLFSVTMAAPGYAAGGKALGVDPDASATTDEVTRTLTVGSDLAIGDIVVTGDKGLVQILFEDKTELVVGPRSRLVIEDYLLRADGSAGKFAINALSGTFRFATGVAAKDRYQIKTPTGTIGVRGTEFDFNVDENGTEVLLFRGGLQLCNLKGVCVSLDGSCQVGTFDLADALLVGPTDDITGDAREDLRQNFIYAEAQSPLKRQFWVDNARECLNKPFVGNTSTNLDPSSSTDKPPREIPDDECDYNFAAFFEGGGDNCCDCD